MDIMTGAIGLGVFAGITTAVRIGGGGGVIADTAMTMGIAGDVIVLTATTVTTDAIEATTAGANPKPTPTAYQGHPAEETGCPVRNQRWRPPATCVGNCRELQERRHEREHVPTLQLATNDDTAARVDAMNLKDRFCDVEADRRATMMSSSGSWSPIDRNPEIGAQVRAVAQGRATGQIVRTE